MLHDDAHMPDVRSETSCPFDAGSAQPTWLLRATPEHSHVFSLILENLA